MSEPHTPSPEDDDRTVIRPAVRDAAPAPAVATPSVRALTPDGNTLPVGTYVGEFEVTGLLGEGGFGIVYLAWDHSLERKVALKEYMPAALAARGAGLSVSVKSARHQDTFEAGLRSFVNEAKLLAQFDHPSMVKVYRFWEDNGTAYMVMPFYEGTTLKDTLKAMGQAPDEAWLMGLLAPVTEALDVLHAQQCYHRDIAPDNIILLKSTGKPLLLDFGAARRVIGDMTQALTVILKAGYAPVEQYAEVPGMKQGPWTDVYALAASVYFSIHGKTPPPAVGRLVQDGYVPLAESAAGRYSARFLQAIDRALAVKPEERTQNMAALRADLGLSGASLGADNAPVLAPAFAPQAASRPAQPPQAAPTVAPATDPAVVPAKAGQRPLWALAAGGVAVAVAAAAWLMRGGQGVDTASMPASAATAATPSASLATAASAPIEPARATAPFDPVTELRRIADASSSDFIVEATATKPRFRIGHDRLSFSFASNRAGYAYVLLVSTDGTFMKLYPNKMSKPNRVSAGEHITLPHASWPMDVAGPPGVDHFVVIVSTNPRDFSALGEVNDGGFVEFPRAQAEAAFRAHRGPGSAFAGKARCDAGVSPCVEDYGAAYFSLEEHE
ncbi:MAG: protein kinase [Aquabacterium commune]|uniref:protein kinase domain-containing protein n=1 Tax=Aquabacterium commune TaxID=70586 RepID=UPI003BB1CFE5